MPEGVYRRDKYRKQHHSSSLRPWAQRWADHRQVGFRCAGHYIRKYDIRSLKGELVRSFEECEIANFLYLHGVAYEYEVPYEHDLAPIIHGGHRI